MSIAIMRSRQRRGVLYAKMSSREVASWCALSLIMGVVLAGTGSAVIRWF
jgi:hypothetical protein